MILRGHEAAPGVRVHARLVVPAVPVRQLAGLAPHSLGQELESKAFSHSHALRSGVRMVHAMNEQNIVCKAFSPYIIVRDANDVF